MLVQFFIPLLFFNVLHLRRIFFWLTIVFFFKYQEYSTIDTMEETQLWIECHCLWDHNLKWIKIWMPPHMDAITWRKASNAETKNKGKKKAIFTWFANKILLFGFYIGIFPSARKKNETLKPSKNFLYFPLCFQCLRVLLCLSLAQVIYWPKVLAVREKPIKSNYKIGHICFPFQLLFLTSTYQCMKCCSW